MTPTEVERIALALPGAALSIKWGDHRAFVVGDKMFAILSGPSEPERLSFKCSDVAFAMLVQQEGVIPAPYLARAKWVQITALDVLPAEELAARLAEAHRLVATKLPKKLRPPGV